MGAPANNGPTVVAGCVCNFGGHVQNGIRPTLGGHVCMGGAWGGGGEVMIFIFRGYLCQEEGCKTLVGECAMACAFPLKPPTTPSLVSKDDFFGRKTPNAIIKFLPKLSIWGFGSFGGGGQKLPTIPSLMNPSATKPNQPNQSVGFTSGRGGFKPREKGCFPIASGWAPFWGESRNHFCVLNWHPENVPNTS